MHNPPPALKLQPSLQLEEVSLTLNSLAGPVDILSGVSLAVMARGTVARTGPPGSRILYADEPTGNLDGATGSGIADLIFGLNAERGATLFLVTHEESLARRCGRMLRMADGKIAADA